MTNFAAGISGIIHTFLNVRQLKPPNDVVAGGVRSAFVGILIRELRGAHGPPDKPHHRGNDEYEPGAAHLPHPATVHRSHHRASRPSFALRFYRVSALSSHALPPAPAVPADRACSGTGTLCGSFPRQQSASAGLARQTSPESAQAESPQTCWRRFASCEHHLQSHPHGFRQSMAFSNGLAAEEFDGVWSFPAHSDALTSTMSHWTARSCRNALAEAQPSTVPYTTGVLPSTGSAVSPRDTVQTPDGPAVAQHRPWWQTPA